MNFKSENTFRSRRSFENEINQQFNSCMGQLETFWRELGIDRNQIMDRSNTVMLHIRNLLDDLVKEEEELLRNIKNRIQKYEQDLKVTCSELGEEFDESNNDLPLLKKDKYLFSQLESLNSKKANRIENYKRLQKNESRLCSELGMPQLSQPLSGVPKLQELEQLEHYVIKLSDIRENRYFKFCQTKDKLATILEETHITPEMPFVKEVVTSDNEKPFLSQEKLDEVAEVLEKVQKLKTEMVEEIEVLMKKLNNLWDLIDVEKNVKLEFCKQHSEIRRSAILAIKQEIKRCEEIRQKTIKCRISELREELVILWNNCYVSESERHHFDPFYLETYTEDVLTLHEKEVERLRKYHEDTKLIFNKINQRQDLWNKMLEFEKKAQDPNRFFMNRGGKLLQEERERNKLLKNLPKLEEEILKDVGKYELSKSPILINGLSFVEYIKQQWENHQREKENERLERQKQRKQLDSVSSCTPHRPLVIKPVSAPSKLLRSNAALSTAQLNKRCATPTNLPLSAKKCKTSTKKTSVRFTKIKNAKTNVLMEKNSDEVESPNNSTVYADFAKELNRTVRERLRSSTAVSKYRVLGSRVKRRNTLRRSRRHQNDSGGSTKSKNLKTKNSKFTRSASKTSIKNIPNRGKLGLPFLI